MITLESKTFYGTAATPFENMVFSDAGWRFLHSRQQWTTGNIARVTGLRHLCDAKAGALVDAWEKDRHAAVAASIAASADVRIPAPPGLTYRPYQLAGIAFMAARHSTLNADVPRLGKTIQALGLCNVYDRPLNVLVLCPALAKTNWCREALKWLVKPASVGYIDGKFNPQSAFLVCNYEMLDRHIEYLKTVPWDIIIADEAHYLKNAQAKRTKHFFSLPRPSLHMCFMTGTPFYTKPIDIWNIVEACDPNGLGRKWWSFIRRYCNAHKKGGIWDYVGSSNEEELQFKMRKTFMVRREKSDVVKEIPPTRNTIVLPKKGLERLIAKEDQQARQGLAALIAAIEAKDPDALVGLKNFDGREEQDVGFYGARRELAIAKIPMIVEHLQEVLLSEKQIVVFTHHRDVTLKLASLLDAACVVGGLTTKQRDVQIESFKSGEKRVIVGNMQAMGTAISLKEADYCAFAEMSWVPSEIDQCEERIWDVTKTTPCTIERFVVEDSLEQAIVAVMEARQASIERMTVAKSLSLVAN